MCNEEFQNKLRVLWVSLTHLTKNLNI